MSASSARACSGPDPRISSGPAAAAAICRPDTCTPPTQRQSHHQNPCTAEARSSGDEVMAASRPRRAGELHSRPEGGSSKPPFSLGLRLAYSIRAKEGAVDARFDSRPSM